MSIPIPEGYRHYSDVRVRFAETDAQGVVYHANFLIYCEVARIDYGRAMRQGAPREPRNWAYVLAHTECDYRASARFDDLLRVFVRCTRVGTSSIAYEYKIVKHDGTLVCDAKTVQVAVHPQTRKPVPLPPEVGERIRAFESGAT
jgi:acyl-CoA thioester hydrolase